MHHAFALITTIAAAFGLALVLGFVAARMRLPTLVGYLLAVTLLLLIVGRRALPWLLWQVTRTGSRELFTLCVVAAAVTIAYGSAELFGVSFALGAFYAGMVLRTPLVFAASEPALRRIRARSALARKLDRSDDPLAELPMSTDTRFLKNQVVIVGYG